MSESIENYLRAMTREEIRSSDTRSIMEEIVRDILLKAKTPKRLLTAPEVAEIFGVHVMTVYKAKRAGVLPFVPTGLKGRNFGFDPDVIEEIKESGGLKFAEEPRTQSAA